MNDIAVMLWGGFPLLNNNPNVQVCDATGDASSTKAGYLNIYWKEL
jgi:hypothetical protein